ncbi:hypothetical protein [Candidatus Shikimatogenerans bostrichidophilus]|uniref:hypothetical protein n=1 Tax=Candidatus Shikimatogenerans bostrichidophilus TaxID=2943807 RepID=UPI002966BACB
MLKFKNIIIYEKLLIKYNNPLLYFLNLNNKYLLLNNYINKNFVLKFINNYCLLCKKKLFLEMDIVNNVILKKYLILKYFILIYVLLTIILIKLIILSLKNI